MLCVTLGGLVPTMCMIIFACVFEYVWTQMAENEQIKVKNQVRITGQVVPHYSTVMPGSRLWGGQFMTDNVPLYVCVCVCEAEMFSRW